MNTKKLLIAVLLVLAILLIPVNAFADTELTNDDFADALAANGETTAKGIRYDSIDVDFCFESGDYKFMEDIDLGEASIYLESGDYVLDLNGKAIESSESSEGEDYEPAIYCGSESVVVIKGNGSIINEVSNYIVGSFGILTIKDGTFDGEIYIGAGATATVEDGTFNNFCVSYYDAEEPATVTINGGTFATESEWGAPAYFYLTDLTINGGSFSAKGASAIYYSGYGETSLTITDGKFTSEADNGIEAIEGADTITISGGVFTGYASGISLAGFKELKLSGGKFVATGEDEGIGGIRLISLIEGEHSVDEFEDFLVEGYEYSPAVDAAEHEEYGYIYTQSEIEVIKTKTTEEEKKDEENEEELVILDGGDQTFEGEDLVVRSSGEFSNFAGLQMDEEDVDPENYEKAEGSTIVTLKASYLASLDAGVHTLAFLYNDGRKVETTVTIPEPITPDTGDNIAVYITLFVIAAIGTVVMFKKK